MALRHAFPNIPLPDLRLDAEPEKAPPVPKQPHDIRFRRGGDIAAAAQTAVSFAYSSVVADMGAGKSTSLPRSMAEAAGAAVIHAMPNRQLARRQYKHLSSLGVAEYHLWLDPVDEIPTSGIVLTSYAVVCARILIRRGHPASLGRSVLVADEIHESDFGSYITKTLGPNLGGLVSFVKTSATMGLDTRTMSEPAGKLDIVQYEPVDPAEWDPGMPDKPWSIANFSGDALLFVDDDRVARNLVASYNSLGACAFRLSAKMPDVAFDEAMRALDDPRSPVVVLIADYAYRSGFTFNVTTVVDSGLVIFTDVQDGEPRFVTRIAYQGEMDQAARRGARIEGTYCKVYQPNIPYKRAMCSLEGVELAAAAVIFRYLGYRPPAEIHALTPMSAGNVPQDLVAALNSDTPLLIQPAEGMWSLVKPAVVEEAGVSPEAVDVLASYSSADNGVEVEDFFAAISGLEEDKPVTYADNSDSILESLQALQFNTVKLQFGNYYALHGLTLRDGPIPMYGMNWQLAVQEIQEKPYVVKGFDRDDKEAILSVLLLHYNHSVLVVRATDRLVSAKDTLNNLGAKYPTMVGSWANQMSASVRKQKALGKIILNAIEELRDVDMVFSAVEPDERAEKNYASAKAQALHNVVQHAVARIDSESVFTAIEGLAQPVGDVMDLPMAEGRGGRRDKVTFGLQRIQGGGYICIIKPERAVMWAHANYVDALKRFVDKSQVSMSLVKKLKIDRADINAVKVLADANALVYADNLPTLKYKTRRRIGP